MGQNAPPSASQKPRTSQQLDTYVAFSPDAILVWDWAGKLLLLNAAALRLFEVQAVGAWLGTSAQQFLQRYTWCDEQQRPFSFAPWLLDLTTFKEEAAPFPYEQTLVLALPSRHQVFLGLRCALVLDGKQQPTGVLAVFHALAPRYQRSLHVQRVYEALKALNEAIERIPEQRSGASSDETLLLSPPVILVAQQFVDVIRQVLACWGVKLLAFRAPNLHLSYIVGSGFTTEQNQWFREIGQHLRFTDFFDKTTLARLQANQAAILPPEHIRTPVGYPEEFGDATLLALPLFSWALKEGSGTRGNTTSVLWLLLLRGTDMMERVVSASSGEAFTSTQQKGGGCHAERGRRQTIYHTAWRAGISRSTICLSSSRILECDLSD